MQKPFFQHQGRSTARRWRVGLWSWVLATLLASIVGPQAQVTNTVTDASELMQADDNTGNDMTQTADDETAGTNVVSDTNQLSTPGPDGRTRRRRRMQNRPRGAVTSPDSRSGANDTNSSPSSLDYSAFRLIVDRNIFDPNRAPHSRSTAQPKTSPTFTLVGTMSYEKGIFAFFDGTSGDYKKAVKPDGTIAGYKVTGISADAVKLAQGSNTLELAVGTQMRRRDDGTWEKSTSSESSTSSSNSTNESTPTGAESDIIKKMMMRREKE